MKEIYKGGYIIQPYAFNRLTVQGRRITKAETVVLSAIYSMSANGGKARYSYSTLSRTFRLAKSTVARCVGALCDEGLIEQDKSNRTAAEYTYVGPEVGNGSLRGEAYLFSEKFTYRKREEGELIEKEVVLTKSEVRLLNKIMSVKSLEASESQLASMLSLSERAVRNAVDRLLHTNLIVRPKKGACASRKSVFVVKRKTVEALREKHKKSKEENGYEVVFVPKAVKDANLRAEREKYYAQKKAEREARQDKIDELLRKNETYNAAQKAFFAALHDRDSATMAKCEETMKKIKEKVSAHFAKNETCDCCDDTGILPDGTYCTCWMKSKKRC